MKDILFDFLALKFFLAVYIYSHFCWSDQNTFSLFHGLIIDTYMGKEHSCGIWFGIYHKLKIQKQRVLYLYNVTGRGTVSGDSCYKQRHHHVTSDIDSDES